MVGQYSLELILYYSVSFVSETDSPVECPWCTRMGQPHLPLVSVPGLLWTGNLRATLLHSWTPIRWRQEIETQLLTTGSSQACTKAFGELSGQIGMPLISVSDWARAFWTTVLDKRLTSALAIFFNILQQLKRMWLNRSRRSLQRQNAWSTNSFIGICLLISTEIKLDPK